MILCKNYCYSSPIPDLIPISWCYSMPNCACQGLKCRIWIGNGLCDGDGIWRNPVDDELAWTVPPDWHDALENDRDLRDAPEADRERSLPRRPVVEDLRPWDGTTRLFSFFFILVRRPPSRSGAFRSHFWMHCSTSFVVALAVTEFFLTASVQQLQFLCIDVH